jgi:hypothetical protein
MKNNKYIEMPPKQIIGLEWKDCGFK